MITINCFQAKKTNVAGFVPIRNSWVDEYWLLLHFYNEFRYYSNGQMKEGLPDQYVLYPPHERSDHTGSLKSDKGHIADYIWFKGNDADELLSDGALPLNTAFSIPRLSSETVMEHFFRMNNAVYLYEKGSDHMRSAIITELLVKMINSYNESSEGLSDMVNSKLEKTRKYIFKHFDSDLTIEELARVAGYSKSRFQYLYRTMYGISPMDDLLKFRIHQAKILLELGQFSITEISRQCGFSSIHYFSNFFKKLEGIPPSKYTFAARKPNAEPGP